MFHELQQAVQHESVIYYLVYGSSKKNPTHTACEGMKPPKGTRHQMEH